MIKRILFSLASVLIATVSAPAQTTWQVDNAHSRVKFSVSHLVISEVEGSFNIYSGTLRASSPDFTDAAVDFEVDATSINTENDMRDKHLRSGDFFNADMYPKMTFKSISWKKIDDRRYTLEGDLTIRDVTRRVTFGVVYGGTTKDPWGNTKAGFKATTVINRFDFGLKWNSLTELGGAVVGKDVSVTLNLEFAKQRPS